MGLTNVKLTIYNVDNPPASTDTEPVSTKSSVLTWISEDKLKGLGIKPRRRGQLKTIEGRVVERDVGIMGVRYRDEEAIVEVVFAIDGDSQVLGVTALESLGYRVNPATGKLEYIRLLTI